MLKKNPKTVPKPRQTATSTKFRNLTLLHEPALAVATSPNDRSGTDRNPRRSWGGTLYLPKEVVER